ncbi:MAG: helicase HerA domain-containing protein [Nanobdellota archaeon]
MKRIEKSFSESAINIAKKELKKKKKEGVLEFLLLFFALFSTSAILIMFTANLISTGFLTYVPAEAGNITAINLTIKFQTSYWHGLYGLAIRVPGYSQELSEELNSGEITSTGLFFDCMQQDALGGREIYASISPIIDFDSLSPATVSQVDSWTGCSGSVDCASNTFLETMWVMVGLTNITNIPSTHTYRWDGEQGIFDIGILNDSENLVYVTHIEDLQKGYSEDTMVNFQMLLPMLPASSEEYYFFTDPYDQCPEGGIGEVISSIVSGYVFNSTGSPIPNITVVIAGEYYITNSEGFYNISLDLMEGSHNLFAYGEGYDEYFSNVTVNFTNYIINKNITMQASTPSISETIYPLVWGYVTNSIGAIVDSATIYLGGETVVTDSNGFYSIYAEITPQSHPIIATSPGYNNYYYILNFSTNTTSLNHNITLTALNLGTTNNPYLTGPYDQEPGEPAQVIEVEKTGEDYWISTKEIYKEIRQNTFVEDTIGIYNFKLANMNLLMTISSELSDFVKLSRDAMQIEPGKGEELILTFYGTKPLGTYEGSLKIGGDIEKEIPITVKIVEKTIPIETLLIAIDLFKNVINPGQNLNYRITLQNLLVDQEYKVSLEKLIIGEKDSEIYFRETQEVEIKKSLSIVDQIKIPSNFSEGDYLFVINAKYLGFSSSVTSPFSVRRPIYLYSFLGIPLWVFFAILSFASFIFLNIFLYKRYKERRKRYDISLDLSTLPKADKKFFKLGLIAESKNFVYLEPEKLKTHAIVAGATGMGKSISAQVLVEEALLKNVAVIVFDPTAQWSGLLRKCEDKKMISFYPKFGLKPSDARGFPGNIRQISHAREIIEIEKYIHPGQIQIFALNKLDPKDIDMFIASVIRQIFKSDPKEAQDLKVLLVFDEVHRLLSKFGGSGEGFLQIERACREFRKWGMGVILISQVLSDFVGEVKANINTEIQTRTIEESDLERIKTKYGEEFLKSLVRAEVGVAMFQNAEYNKGKPYFVNFRPILHNTRRLSDEELEKYNKYNEIIDDFESQVEQLEKEKVDIFDLKMELKLIKDKLMTGNFSVVDIYVEGLGPRLQKQWEKIGKKPKKVEKKLLDASEIQKSVEEAKKARELYEKEEMKKKKLEESKTSST